MSILEKELARHSRRVRRVVRLHLLPTSGSYEPPVEGTATALPHLDDFSPLDSLRDTQELAQHCHALPARPSGVLAST